MPLDNAHHFGQRKIQFHKSGLIYELIVLTISKNLCFPSYNMFGYSFFDLFLHLHIAEQLLYSYTFHIQYQYSDIGRSVGS